MGICSDAFLTMEKKMKKTWLLLIMLLALALSMGLAIGCGDDDDDGEPDAAPDTDTDTDTDTDVDASTDAGEACATVTANISIGEGFPGPAIGIVVALYLEEPNLSEVVLPDVAGELIEEPDVDSSTPYALTAEVCGIVSGTDYWTGVVVFAGTPGLPNPGDAIGLKEGADTYDEGGTVALGDLELSVVPAP